ncbi:MAG: cytochrome P450 [Acidimicrobiales bacterium]|nr:cytochrome P450 [Hyphomonadaceae bacterium]RZV44103.1 MAG: cytochrome P450 [Acidimicrobiales bacterium]
MDVPRVEIDPFSEEFLSDPFAHHPRLREVGPVFWLDSIGVYGVARHEEVTQVLKNHDVFVSSRGVGLADFSKEKPFRPPSLLLEADPPLHNRTRDVMNRIVAMPVLKGLEDLWRTKAKELVAELIQKDEFDAVIDLAEEFPMRVFPDAVGLMDEGRHHLLTYAAIVFNAFGPRNKIFEDGMADAAEASEWVAQACKRENLKKDGWGEAVFQSADRGDCTHQEAERLVRSLLSAGVDTTVNGVSNLMYAFTQFPDEWEKMGTDQSSTRRAFNEGLRWRSTVQTFFRTAAQDTTLANVEIPEGSKVLTFLAAANRDERRWENPNDFSVTRNASGHVGFGHGIHVCLGQMVARMEADALLSAMREKISRITAVGAPVIRLNNTLCSIESLPVKIEKIGE